MARITTLVDKEWAEAFKNKMVLGTLIFMPILFMILPLFQLALMRNINQASPGTSLSQTRRPYATQYPQLAAINMLDSIGRSEYNSLQMSLIQNRWHGLSGRLNYTLGHTMDNGSEARNTLPLDSFNIEADWGNAAFDIRHVATAGFTYDLPAFGSGRFGDGWQVTGDERRARSHVLEQLQWRGGVGEVLRPGKGQGADVEGA